MRNFFSKKLFLWTSCVIILFAAAGYFAMDIGVEYVLKSMVSESKDKPSDASDVTKEPKEPREKSVLGETSVPNPKSQPDNTQSSEEADPEENKESVDRNLSPSVVDSSAPSDKDANKETSTQEEPETKYTGEVTPEKVEKAEEVITFREKTKVTAVLLKSLSASDIKMFMDMSDSHVSTEEKKAAKKVFLEKMSEEEYDELIAIAAKLGLSQGKSYADSLKEYQ